MFVAPFWGLDDLGIHIPKEKCPNGCDSLIDSTYKGSKGWVFFCSKCLRMGPYKDTAGDACEAWDKMCEENKS